MFLEDFAPHVVKLRQRIFAAGIVPVNQYVGNDRYATKEKAVIAWLKKLQAGVLSVGDPAGATKNSQGTNRSAVTVLRDYGIHVETEPNANNPERRNYAIQTVSGYMRRSLPNGEPCFLVSDRFYRISLTDGVQERSFLVDGFESGYVWGALSIANTASPNTRRPAKDGVYDHSQNTVEYAVLKFAPPDAAAAAGVFHTELERRRYEQQSARDKARLDALAERDAERQDELMLREHYGQVSGRSERGGYFNPDRSGGTHDSGPRGGYGTG
jgi:hypothetical protein